MATEIKYKGEVIATLESNQKAVLYLKDKKLTGDIDIVAPAPVEDWDGSVIIEGGVELISFTINGTAYQAESGMTWYEWCNSNYNTYGYSTSNASYVHKNIEGQEAYICKSASGGFNNCVLGNGVIDANGVYYHYIHLTGSGN